MKGIAGIKWRSSMRRLTLGFHKPPSGSVAAGRLAYQKPNSILKMIKPFHLPNASTVFIATYAAAVIATTMAWVWMLVGLSKWALGF
jgi:hypothetical protein